LDSARLPNFGNLGSPETERAARDNKLDPHMSVDNLEQGTHGTPTYRTLLSLPVRGCRRSGSSHLLPQIMMPNLGGDEPIDRSRTKGAKNGGGAGAGHYHLKHKAAIVLIEKRIKPPNFNKNTSDFGLTLFFLVERCV
jgi:hypothetical protein